MTNLHESVCQGWGLNSWPLDWSQFQVCVISDLSNMILTYCTIQLSHLVTKPTKWHVRPAKTQISLGIHPVWSESWLSAWRKLGFLATHWAHSEDSDQTGRMPRLIWVFAGHTVILLVLSWGGSVIHKKCRHYEKIWLNTSWNFILYYVSEIRWKRISHRTLPVSWQSCFLVECCS